MTLVVKTVSDSKAAQKDLATLKQSIGNIETSLQSATEKFASFGKSIAASVAALGAIKTFAVMSDSMTNLENKIRSVAESEKQFTAALQGVKDVAIATRAPLAATAALYQRIALNQKEIGINTKDTLRVVSVVNKAMAVSGVAANEASAALLQFGQAIGSGRLQGDELRSLSENAPMLLKAIADNMGISMGKMKKAGEEGLLTTAKILPALLAAEADIDAKFGKLKVTYGGAINNMGTSLSLLKDSISKYFMGTGGALANWLNNIALGTADVAKYFAYYMGRARSFVAKFVISALILFEDLWPDVLAGIQSIADGAMLMYEAWKPTLIKLTQEIREWAAVGAAVIGSVFASTAQYVQGTELYAKFSAIFSTVKGYAKSAMAEIGKYFKIPEIDVSKFLTNLEPMMAYVTKFVTHIERAFFWVYDQVIGHSWIPDLVIGVITWIKKLLGSPLAMVGFFAKRTSLLFRGIFAAAGFSMLLRFTNKYIGTLLKLVAVLGVTGFLIKGMFASGNSMADMAKGVFSGELMEAKRPKGAADNVEDTKPREGIKDRIKRLWARGTVQDKAVNAKEVIEVKSKELAASVNEKLKKLPALKDMLSFIPGGLMLTVAGLISAGVALGIMNGIKNKAVAKAVLALFAVSAGALSLKVIGQDRIASAANTFAYTVMDVLERGLTTLLGGNAIFNLSGLAGILGAFALLFAAGRKAIGAAASGIMKSPTMLSRNWVASGEAKYRDAVGTRQTAQALALPQKRADAFNASTLRYQDAITRMAATAGGGSAGTRAAIQAARTGYGSMGINGLDAAAARQARLDRIEARKGLNNVAGEAAKLRNEGNNNLVRAAQINSRLADARENTLTGIKNGAGAIGGVIGGVAGYQLGTEISRGMSENTPAWQKMAVIMSVSVAGQFIASGVAAMLAAALITTSSAVFGVLGKGFATATSGLVYVLTKLPWWASLGIAIIASFVVVRAMLESLGPQWVESFKNWNRTAVDIGGANSTSDAVGLTRSDAEQAKLDKRIAEGNAFAIPVAGGYSEIAKAQTEALKDGLLPMLAKYWAEKNKEIQPNLPKLSPELEAKRLANIVDANQKGFVEKAIPVIADKATLAFNAVGEFIRSRFETATPIYVAPPAAPVSPIKRASGGPVWGAGGPTDDKIPALLSNGEFVINAEDTKRNFGLLTAINDGKLGRFAAGGSVSDAIGTFTGSGGRSRSSYDEAPVAVYIAGLTPNVSKAFFDPSKEKALQSGIAALGDSMLASISKLVQHSPMASDIVNMMTTAVKSMSAPAAPVIGVDGVPVPAAAGVPTYTPPKLPTYRAPAAAPDENTFKGKLLDMTPTAFRSNIATTLKAADFQGIHPDDLKGLTVGVESKLTGLVSSLKYFQNIATTRAGKQSGRLAAAEAANIKADIDTIMVQSVYGEEGPSNFYKAPEDAKDAKKKKGAADKVLVLQDQFAAINESFPRLSLSVEEFRKMSDDVREEIYAAAAKSSKRLAAINNTPIDVVDKTLAAQGKTRQGVGEKGVKAAVNEEFAKTEEERLAGEAAALSKIAPSRSFFKSVKLQFSEIGMNISDSVAGVMTSLEAISFAPAVESIRADQKKLQETAGLPEEERTRISKGIADRLEAIRNDLDEIEHRTFKSFDLSSRLGQALGAGLDRSSFQKLLEPQQTALNRTMLELTRKAAEAYAMSGTKAGVEAQVALDAALRAFKRDMATLSEPTRAEKMEIAGIGFAQTVSDGFTTSFTAALKGQAAEGRSVLSTLAHSFVDMFTSTVIDTVMKGLTDQVFGKKGFVTNMLTDLGSGLFGIGSDVGTTGEELLSGKFDGQSAGTGLFVQFSTSALQALGLAAPGMKPVEISTTEPSIADADFVGPPAPEGTGNDAAAVGGIAKDLGGLAQGTKFGGAMNMLSTGASLFGKLMEFDFSKIVDGISSAFSSITGAFGFADGGHVAGPGTGTSDSIPAMLSNGEFVVNAAATKRFAPLLSSINSGQFKRFAEGGMVNTANVAPLAMADVAPPESTRANSQQTINLQITGDISRQTKAEIYRMLPSIADGVNSHNKEKGYRG